MRAFSLLVETGAHRLQSKQTVLSREKLKTSFAKRQAKIGNPLSIFNKKGFIEASIQLTQKSPPTVFPKPVPPCCSNSKRTPYVLIMLPFEAIKEVLGQIVPVLIVHAAWKGQMVPI